MRRFATVCSFWILTLCFCGGTASAAEKKENKEIMVRVDFERIENNGECSSKKECDIKIRDFLDTIPNVSESDNDLKKDRVFLLMTDKRLVSAAAIKAYINKSKLIKVKKVYIPAPKEKIDHKDPYEGMSNKDIKKAYDAYYRENPDLKPKNWEFSN